MRSSTCYVLAIFGICPTFLALARAVNKISPSFISLPSPLIFWLHFTTGSTYHRDDNTVNTLRYVQQKLSSIKYTASCFLLELEQMVYIFSVLVLLFFAFMLHRFTISLVSLIKLSTIK